MKEFDKEGCIRNIDNIAKAARKRGRSPEVRLFARKAVSTLTGYIQGHSDSGYDEASEELSHCKYAVEALTHDKEDFLVKAINEAYEWIWKERIQMEESMLGGMADEIGGNEE